LSAIVRILQVGVVFGVSLTLPGWSGSQNAGSTANQTRSTPKRGGDLPGMPSAAERAAAQKKEADALAAIDPRTAADIRYLIKIMGAKNITSQTFNSLIAPLKDMLLDKMPPDENRRKIVNRFIQLMEDRVSSGDLDDLLIPVYAKHFSHDDIKSMIAFYDSPAGRHLVQESPVYLRDVQEAASEHWRLIAKPEILEEMRKEFPEGEKSK